MVWNGKFLDIAWQSQCHLINYPTALEEKGCIIGADFKPKAISSRTYKEFMPTLMEVLKSEAGATGGGTPHASQNSVLRIVGWDSGASRVSCRRRTN